MKYAICLLLFFTFSCIDDSNRKCLEIDGPTYYESWNIDQSKFKTNLKSYVEYDSIHFSFYNNPYCFSYTRNDSIIIKISDLNGVFVSYYNSFHKYDKLILPKIIIGKYYNIATIIKRSNEIFLFSTQNEIYIDSTTEELCFVFFSHKYENSGNFHDRFMAFPVNKRIINAENPEPFK